MTRTPKVLHRLTYANIVATLALFLALGGTSYAAIKLSKNAVRTINIAPNAVTSAKIKNGQVLGADLGASSVSAAKVAAGAVTNAKIAPGAVTGANLGASAVGAANLAPGAVTNASLGASSVAASNIASGAVTAAALTPSMQNVPVAVGAVSTSSPFQSSPSVLMSKSITVPGAGVVLARADGDVTVLTPNPGTWEYRLKLNTGTSTDTSEDGFVVDDRGFDPGGANDFHMPFSVTRTFAVAAAGALTVNLTGVTGANSSSAAMELDQTAMTLEYFPGQQ